MTATPTAPTPDTPEVGTALTLRFSGEATESAEHVLARMIGWTVRATPSPDDDDFDTRPEPRDVTIVAAGPEGAKFHGAILCHDQDEAGRQSGPIYLMVVGDLYVY